MFKSLTVSSGEMAKVPQCWTVILSRVIFSDHWQRAGRNTAHTVGWLGTRRFQGSEGPEVAELSMSWADCLSPPSLLGEPGSLLHSLGEWENIGSSELGDSCELPDRTSRIHSWETDPDKTHKAPVWAEDTAGREAQLPQLPGESSFSRTEFNLTLLVPMQEQGLLKSRAWGFFLVAFLADVSHSTLSRKILWMEYV